MFPSFLVKRLFFFTAILFALSYFSTAQQYNFKTYSVADGLPQSQVFAICQDSRGYLWFGTGGGLCRFDGTSFKNFSTQDGMSSGSVRALFEDSQKNLWIGTYGGGVIKFDGKDFKSYTTLEGLNNNIVRVIYEDSKGNLWFGTDGGGVAKITGDKFTHFSTMNGLSSGRIWSIAEDNSGNMWFGTLGGGACKLENNLIKQVPILSQTSKLNVWVINKDHGNNLLFGTDAGIFRFDGKDFSLMNTGNFFSHNMIRALLRDKEGNLWIGSNGEGLLRYNAGSSIYFNTQNGLSNNIILSIMQDRERNIWIGTNGGGVSRYGGIEFINYTEKDGLANNNIWSVLQDKQGNFWFGSNGLGVSRFEDKKSSGSELGESGGIFTNFSEKDGLGNNRIWCALEDSEGIIWFGTEGGLSKFDGLKKNRGSFVNYSVNDGLTHNSVLSLCEDKEKNIWTGTYGGGVSMFNRKTFKNYFQGNGLVNNKVWCVFQDSKGNLWFGTDGGISVFDGKSFKNFTIKNGLSNNVILSIVEDSKKNIWIGSYGGGIMRCNINNPEIQFEKINGNDGLSDNLILSLVFENDSTLWIGTYNGLVKFDAGTYLNTGKVYSTHFGNEEGFSGIECNLNASCRDKNGTLWFGTTNGVVKYNSAEARKPNMIESKTHVTRHRIFLKDTALASNSVLPYHLNHLTFDFVGLCFSNPLKVRYRYLLSGFDLDWSPPAKESRATYSNLPPGKYEFKVISSNNENIWNNDPETFSFEITPPFWKTIWFYGLTFLLVAGSIFFLVQIRIRRLQSAKKFLEKIVSERTREISHQKDVIEENNKDIIRSIRYAKRIQEAIFPPEKLVKDCLPDSFVLFMPKDIVSGDFYWVSPGPALSGVGDVGDACIFFAAVDCTGHGVPGAFMSIVGNEALHRAVNEHRLKKPSEVLDYLNLSVNKTLRQTYDESMVKDGMDIALCQLEIPHKKNPQTGMKLNFAGAYNPVWVVKKSNRNLIEINGNKHPIGAFDGEALLPFTNHEIEVEKGDVIYVFSDGYADQFGGPKGKKFKLKQLKQILTKISQNPMADQREILRNTHEEWRKNLEQVDDICIIGVRV